MQLRQTSLLTHQAIQQDQIYLSNELSSMTVRLEDAWEDSTIALLWRVSTILLKIDNEYSSPSPNHTLIQRYATEIETVVKSWRNHRYHGLEALDIEHANKQQRKGTQPWQN